MATYGTDLTAIDDADDDTSWVEFTPYAGGGAPANDGENLIQGVDCVSQSTGQALGLNISVAYNAGSDQSGSFATGDCVFMWQFYAVGANLEDYATGGLRFGVGSSTSAIDSYVVGGSDYGRNPYGGWQNVVVDPTRTGDYQDSGGNGGAWQVFGSIGYTLAKITKGTPHAVDAIRYGRGEIYATGTGANFTDMAQENDYNDVTNGYNRWGLFQAQPGGFLWKGLMSLGQPATSVTFNDSNKVITIDDCPKTYDQFNKIEVNNASSSVTWNNISFNALGTTAPGHFEVISGTLDFDGCTFQNMGTFVFNTTSDVNNCIFQTCSGIDSGGADMVGSSILTPTTSGLDESALTWNVNTNPDGYLDDMTFSKGANAHHAIEFGTTSPTTLTLRGITFSGFSALNDNDNSVLHIMRDSGTVTVQAVECTGTVSYRSEGATVTVTQGVVTQVTVKDIDTATAIEGARVLLEVTDDSNFPYQDSVTIESTDYTATVSHNSHGLSDNDKIIIRGANQDEYNGVYAITTSGLNYYTYTMNEDPTTSPATGTITATMAIISGTTNGSGVISDQRTLSADQAVSGWVRKASGSPYYKQQPISETIASATGLSVTVLLIKDE